MGFTWFIMVQSGHNFAHATTAKLEIANQTTEILNIVVMSFDIIRKYLLLMFSITLKKYQFYALIYSMFGSNMLTCGVVEENVSRIIKN